jgi:hypothetical protein
MKMLSYSGQQAAEMEEFNRRQRETGVASLPSSPQPAPEASASVSNAPPPLPQPLTRVSELLQTQTATIPQAALQHGVIQSLLSNPMFSNQILQSLQEQLLLQQRQQQEDLQLRAVVQQQQQHQQQEGQTPQQQQPQQANLNQALFLQSVLNMVQQQPGHQQQPVQQQQLAVSPQVSSIPLSLPTSVNAQMCLPFQFQPELLLQQAQNAALLQYLNSQQRIDGAGTGTSTRAESSNVIGDQYSSSSVVGNADGKEEERELNRADANANNKNDSNQSHET